MKYRRQEAAMRRAGRLLGSEEHSPAATLAPIGAGVIGVGSMGLRHAATGTLPDCSRPGTSWARSS